LCAGWVSRWVLSSVSCLYICAARVGGPKRAIK
jgi:hypothetical protein